MMLSNYQRRGLAFLLAFAMTFSLVPVTGFATETEPATVETTVPETEPTGIEIAAPEPEPVVETTAATEAVTEPTTEPEEVSVVEPMTETVSVDNSVAEIEATEETETEESALLAQYQTQIDDILTRYLGTTEMSAKDIKEAVAEMDWETYQTARWEISLLQESLFESFDNGSIAESEMDYFADKNNVFWSLSSELDIRASHDTYISTYANSATLTSGLSITDTDSQITKNSETQVTILAVKGRSSSAGTQTNTITITNTSGSKAKLIFDYTVDGQSAYTIGGGGENTGSRYTITLEAGGNFSITLSAYAGKWGKTTATLTLTNISLSPIADSSNITFLVDETLGTINSGAIKNNQTETVTSEGISLTAAAVSGSSATLLGWIDAEGKIISRASSFTLTPTGDMTVEAVFAKNTPWFYVDDLTYLVEGLSNAVTRVATATNKTIILANNATLPAGDYTIPSGITLLIPFDSTGTCYTTTPAAEYASSQSNPTAYRTLTMANGANIIVNGIMSVSAKVYAGDTGKCAGMPKGTYGHVVMNEGSAITVNGGATLSVSGYVTGDGMITANSGSKIYETFQIMDFRGGTATLGMNGTFGSGNDGDVFVLSQYYIQNIEAPMKIYSGATETIYAALYMQSTIVDSNVAFIADSGAMFSLTSGYLIKRYDKETDKMVVDIHGDLTISSIQLKIQMVITYTINSNIYVLPINNMKVNINSGTVTVGQDMALIPGTEIIVGSGANFVLGSGTRVYVYDSEQWGNYCYSNAKFRPLKYVPNRTYTRTEADLLDAVLHVEGTVDASAGSLYTTESGAAITGEDGGQVIITPGTETVTYQATQSGTSISYPEIPITSAKLKNAVEAEPYTATASNAGTYNYKHGKWILGEHTVTDSVIAPTCTEKGYTIHTCACGYEYQDTEIPALGHTEVIDDAVAATCTETGLTEGKHCSVCDTVLVAQTEVAALGHSYSSTVTNPTFSKKGYTTYTCHCSDSYTEDIIVAQVGEETYTVFSEALNETDSYGTIELKADIDGEVTINKAVTINRNGFSIDGIKADYGYQLKTEETAYTLSVAITLANMECSYDAEVVVRLKFFIPAELLAQDSAAITLTKDGRWGDEETEYTMAQLKENGPDKDGRYVADAGVASGEMTRNVSVAVTDENGNAVTILDKQGNIKESPAYTVRYYITEGRKQFTDVNRIAAAEALAVYGGYAQTYFDVDPEDPAYNIEGFTVPDLSGITAESLSEYQVVKNGDNAGIMVKSFEPYLDSELSLRLRFALDSDEDIHNFTFTLDGPDITDPTLTAFQEEGSDRWCVDIEKIPAAYIDDAYTVTVTNTQTQETHTVTVSVATWIRAILIKSTNDTQKKMAQAMYHYAQACSTLFEK